MKDVIIKILLAALAISCIVVFILSTDGLSGDTKTIRDKSSEAIENRLAP